MQCAFKGSTKKLFSSFYFILGDYKKNFLFIFKGSLFIKINGGFLYSTTLSWATSAGPAPNGMSLFVIMLKIVNYICLQASNGFFIYTNGSRMLKLVQVDSCFKTIGRKLTYQYIFSKDSKKSSTKCGDRQLISIKFKVNPKIQGHALNIVRLLT